MLMSKDKYLVLSTFALSNTHEEYRVLVTSLVILATSTFFYSLEFIFSLLWEVWKMRSFASLYILWILEPLCIVRINLWECALQLQIRTVLKSHGTAWLICARLDSDLSSKPDSHPHSLSQEVYWWLLEMLVILLYSKAPLT